MRRKIVFNGNTAKREVEIFRATATGRELVQASVN
jgi:hypothetical protein